MCCIALVRCVYPVCVYPYAGWSLHKDTHIRIYTLNNEVIKQVTSSWSIFIQPFTFISSKFSDLSGFLYRITYACLFPGMLVTGFSSSKHSEGQLKVNHKLGVCYTLLQQCKTVLIFEEVVLFSYTLQTSHATVALRQSSDFKKRWSMKIFLKSTTINKGLLYPETHLYNWSLIYIIRSSKNVTFSNGCEVGHTSYVTCVLKSKAAWMA